MIADRLAEGSLAPQFFLAFVVIFNSFFLSKYNKERNTRKEKKNYEKMENISFIKPLYKGLFFKRVQLNVYIHTNMKSHFIWKEDGSLLFQS